MCASQRPAGHVGVAGQQAGRLTGQDLRRLADARVVHLGQVDRPLPALRVDDEQGRCVVDLPGLDLHRDVVGPPDRLELGRRAGEEVPLVHHGVRPRIGHDIGHRGGVRVRVHPEQLDLAAGRSEHLPRLHHAHRGQRADRGALRVNERQDDDLAAELVQRHGLAELVAQRDVGSGLAAQRAARVEGRVGVRRLGLAPAHLRRAGLRRAGLRRLIRCHAARAGGQHRDREHRRRKRQPGHPQRPAHAQPPAPGARPVPASDASRTQIIRRPLSPGASGSCALTRSSR